jgi:hypothetical protein
MDHPLHFAPFVEVEKGSSMFDLNPSPEKSGYRVIRFRVKMGQGEMVLTQATEYLFIFPKSVPAAHANPWKCQRNKIVQPFHFFSR